MLLSNSADAAQLEREAKHTLNALKANAAGPSIVKLRAECATRSNVWKHTWHCLHVMCALTPPSVLPSTMQSNAHQSPGALLKQALVHAALQSEPDAKCLHHNGTQAI